MRASWYVRQELNLYDLAATRPSTERVYLFRHGRLKLVRMAGFDPAASRLPDECSSG